MPDQPKVICFRHCSVNNIFCKSVPEKCPICHSDIINFSLDPFCIPYPYVIASNHPVSIVIRPSQGTFLRDYTVSTDLHIGVTDSSGKVTEFDRQGLIINDHTRWTCCVALKIVPPSWDVHWDNVLEDMTKNSQWKSINYDETTMNCFNFIIDFLNNVNYTDMVFKSKEELCERLLLSRIQDAIKYNALFKNVEDKTYYICG